MMYSMVSYALTCITRLLIFGLLDSLVSPRRPSEYWLNNLAWIGIFLIL